DLSEKITLTVYVKTDIDPKTLDPLISEINQLPFVIDTQYQTAADALTKITTKYPESTKFLSQYNVPNPLPATVNIKTNNLEDQRQLIKLFQNEPYKNIFRVNENDQQRSTIQTVINNLINLKGFTFQVILWVILTFTIGGALLIFNVLNVTLFSRRKEIQIMQFVGATHATIRMPFVFEGILYGVASFILSFILLLIIQIFIPESIQEFRSILLSGSFQFTLIIELIAIGIISGVISVLTVENHLKHKGILAD
ncbi:hypothetical protein COY06_00715, partial [Candidatus Peregrinibacteria bacterium CG_4_10_14_0_2_um_filter_41_8]